MNTANFQPEHFLNRELSWLEFNARVLEEAQDERNPLLERVKFLAIFASNMDEFFMVRIAGLREQVFGAMAPQDPPADGLDAITQLQRATARARELVGEQYRCWRESISPALAGEGIRFVRESRLNRSQSKSVDKFFRQRVFPVLTPMAIDPSHPSPRFHNRGLYLAATLRRRQGIGPRDLFAVVQLPSNLPRVVPVEPGATDFLFLEDIVASRLPELFGGYEPVSSGPFRVTRDMDIEVLDEEGDDMLQSIETRLRARQRSEAVRLEASTRTANELLKRVVNEEEIRRGVGDEPEGYNEVYTVDGPIDMTGLFKLPSLVDRSDLRDSRFAPRRTRQSLGDRDVFAAIAEHDILLHHPYDSFEPVVEFVKQAAEDPSVLAIKQTLYRTSGDSPIVDALIDAAEDGKHVTALVELKARFDEANNIGWARRLERAGVHVVFGFMDLKTHCKLALVVRQEGKKVRRYAHLGTGNYNPATARLYTDLGLFTADKATTEEVSALFNFLTGYSQTSQWDKLVIAPTDMQRRTIELIDEQAERARAGKRSRVFAKMNALVDRQTIEALYRASQAGVPIDLVIRGICCLRPGLPGISDTIRVRSIVDRFLEHSRIMAFGDGEDLKVYLSSADWMPRNFTRRVEVMFPVEAPDLRDRILNEIIPVYLRDNQRARLLMPDGEYQRPEPAAGEPLCRGQQELIDVAEGVAPSPMLTDGFTPPTAANGAPAKKRSGSKPAARETKAPARKKRVAK